MQLSELLHLPLGECQEKTTSSDFVKWQVYLGIRQNSPDRSDHYLMQVAALIEQFMEGFAKNPRTIKIADKKIKFEIEDDAEYVESEQPQDSKATPAEVLASKASLANILGIPEFVHGG